MNNDRGMAGRIERTQFGGESILKKLNQELNNLESASRETIKNIYDRSRNLATLYRMPEARKLLGPAIDPVFYDKKSMPHGVVIRRNQKRPRRFIRHALPSQFQD